MAKKKLNWNKHVVYDETLYLLYKLGVIDDYTWTSYWITYLKD